MAQWRAQRCCIHGQGSRESVKSARPQAKRRTEHGVRWGACGSFQRDPSGPNCAKHFQGGAVKLARRSNWAGCVHALGRDEFGLPASHAGFQGQVMRTFARPAASSPLILAKVSAVSDCRREVTLVSTFRRRLPSSKKDETRRFPANRSWGGSLAPVSRPLAGGLSTLFGGVAPGGDEYSMRLLGLADLEIFRRWPARPWRNSLRCPSRRRSSPFFLPLANRPAVGRRPSL